MIRFVVERKEKKPLLFKLWSRLFRVLLLQSATRGSLKQFGLPHIGKLRDYLLVEEVESDAVLPPLHHIVVEGGRVPAVAALSLIGLLPQRGAPQRLPEAVP